MKNKIFKRIARINNFFIFHFNKINEFINIINHKFKNISSFNRYLIFLITILFLYLFYLSIPSLYNSRTIQVKLNNLINEEYNINISLSSKLQYNILPKPHFVIENSKLYTNDLVSPRELGQIKKIKAFISQKNFFKKNEISITNLSINNANFLINKKDLSYLKDFLEKKFSKKKLKIINSKFFYTDEEENVISIFPIFKLVIEYDKKNSKNILNSKGKIFTIPYSLSWNKNFNNGINSTLLKLNKLNFKLENFTDKKKSIISIKNFIFFGSSEIGTDILIKKDLIKIKSNRDSKIKNNKLNYNGEISLNPFHLGIDINLAKLNFKKNIFNNELIHSLLEMKNLYSENLSSIINLRIKKLTKNKLFESSKVSIKFSNGNIDFNNTIFKGKVGNLDLINSNIKSIKGDLIFNGNFTFNIKSKNEFYRLFQINKINRKEIDNFHFDINYNLTKDKFTINNLMFESDDTILENDPSNISNKDEEFTNLKINNWIDFKNFVKKIFINYYVG